MQQYSDSSYPTDPTPRRRLSAGGIIGISLLVLVLVAAVGLVGLEFGMRKNLTDRIQREATDTLGSQATVQLGSRPVVFSAISGSLGTVRITTDGTPVPSQAPAAGTGNIPGGNLGVAGGRTIAPAMDITGKGVSTEGESTKVESLSGTVTVSNKAMAALASGQAGPTSGSVTGGLTETQEITSDPTSGTLKVSIGGLAQVDVTPKVINGKLALQPGQASIFGFQIPSGLLDGTEMMLDSTVADLPEGIEITGVRVVEGGMTLDISGTNVVFTTLK